MLKNIPKPQPKNVCRNEQRHRNRFVHLGFRTMNHSPISQLTQINPLPLTTKHESRTTKRLNYAKQSQSRYIGMNVTYVKTKNYELRTMNCEPIKQSQSKPISEILNIKSEMINQK